MKWGLEFLCSINILSPFASGNEEKPVSGLPIPPSITRKLDKIYLKKKQYSDTRQRIAQQGNSQWKENE